MADDELLVLERNTLTQVIIGKQICSEFIILCVNYSFRNKKLNVYKNWMLY